MTIKPGRQSAASLAVVTPISYGRRLEPPATLAPEDQDLFRQLVASCSPNHFSPADAPLLARYCEGNRLCHAAFMASMKDPGHVPHWERAARVVASMAVRLRLCPHSRIDAAAAGRRAREHRPSYYQMMESESDS